LNNKPKRLSGAAWKGFIYFLKVILWWTPHKQNSLALHALFFETWATTGIIRVRYDPPLDNSVSSANHGEKRNIVMWWFFSGMRRSLKPTKRMNYFCLSALIFKKKNCEFLHYSLFEIFMLSADATVEQMRTNSSVPHPSLCLWRQVM
jgi:hypothetical protein